MEDCLSLDLAWLMRLGPIRDGQAGSGEINWSRDGDHVAAAHFRLDLRSTETARLMLKFHAVRLVEQAITLTALPQHFGGRRWWMICPVTGERVRTLHLPLSGESFASRKAWGLAYRVERLGRFDRPFEKLFRAQRRLGGAQALGMAVQRPKGMWQRTFARHVAALEQRDLACVEQIATLVKRA
ncbi:MAG: hypothetical protein KJZ64_01835 [Sphingomonadaceae bacterium]|nr:hypothetical protein [Sphingomonadaceae bacterium]